MKKKLMILMAMVLGFQMVNANPVDVSTARVIGQQFVQANFELNRQNVDLQLVYTGASTRGEACFYVFNYGNEGFVAVSADDVFRPIVGYSYEGPFDAQNINPEFAFMLNRLIDSRTNRSYGQAAPEVTAEWRSVLETGKTRSLNGGRPRTFLCTTKWNQSPAPYNSMCPADPNGPGGHDYTGCVATAMAQLMKYWNYPTQGTGSHSYICYANPAAQYPGHPEYGTITANFGATTYDWANMLDTYPESGYTPEQGDAVATISFHCGVSVDMMYGNIQDNGSGAYSGDVPGAIYQYFGYSNAAVYRNRDQSSRDEWMSMLKESIDMGWPLYYSGTDPDPVTGGGHAFICDGYDDANLFHYNWGWGGSGNSFFDFDEIDYNTSDGAIFNFVPSGVYANTCNAPTNFSVTKTSDIAQSATVSWTNPSKTLTNTNLTSIDQIVVERGGRVIYTSDNATPGATMSFVDEEVPCYTTFDYRVYAVVDGNKGKMAYTRESFGPTCTWQIIATSSNMAGWKGAKLVAYDGAGHEITSFTMTSSNNVTAPIEITVGKVVFKWQAGTADVDLLIKIKDAQGNVVYQYNGNTSGLTEGVLYEGNNACTGSAPNAINGQLYATSVDGYVQLDWEASSQATYGYNIYRDGVLFQLANTNSFVDEYAEIGGHCYQVCVLSEGGESELSNEACASAGEGCEPALNLWFVIQANGKPIISWTAPTHADGLSNYVVYRKIGDEDYEAIKTLAPNKLQYKETSSLTNGTWYYYKVVAYYEDIDCYAAPAKAQYGNEYFVKIYYSTTGVGEATANVNLYPNPTKDSFTIEAENLQQVMVYNALGQQVMVQECQGNSAVVNLGQVESGIYMVKIVTADGESIQKVSVIK